MSDLHSQFAERFTCPKCNHTQCLIDEMHTTGGGLSKLFDVQNRKFMAVSCQRCGYTELYNLNVLRRRSGFDLGDIIDLLFGG